MPLFVVATAAYFGEEAAWYAAHPLADKGYVPFLYANAFNNAILFVLLGLPLIFTRKDFAVPEG